MPNIRLIAAIDDKLGIAKEQKIPWDLPVDQKYFREKLAGGPVAMGLNTYISNGRKPFGTFENTVFSKHELNDSNLNISHNADEFFRNLDYDIWVAGGGQIFTAALQYATELYLTRVSGDFDCDVFFPEFESMFHKTSTSQPQTENGTEFIFEVWLRNTTEE